MSAPKLSHYHSLSTNHPKPSYSFYIYLAFQGLLLVVNTAIYGSALYGLTVTLAAPLLVLVAGHLQKKKEERERRAAIRLNYSGDSIQNPEERQKFAALVRDL